MPSYSGHVDRPSKKPRKEKTIQCDLSLEEKAVNEIPRMRLGRKLAPVARRRHAGVGGVGNALSAHGTRTGCPPFAPWRRVINGGWRLAETGGSLVSPVSVCVYLPARLWSAGSMVSTCVGRWPSDGAGVSGRPGDVVHPVYTRLDPDLLAGCLLPADTLPR